MQDTPISERFEADGLQGLLDKRLSQISKRRASSLEVDQMDDATGEHTSMFFCHQEGTDSSFHGIGQTKSPLWPVCQPVHRPGQPLLHHA